MMPLRLLLDENISPVVADQAKRRRPDMVIESVHRWRDGSLMNQEDKLLLLAAASDGWTLVTYDQATIPDHLSELHAESLSHAGVIYVNERTISNRDFGLLIKALTDLWDSNPVSDWRDYVHHLKKPSR